MSIAGVWVYVKNQLDGLAWPPAMAGLPALTAWVLPPDPNATASSVPAAYVWGGAGDESRAAVHGGALPRAAYPGGPSGTKGTVHTVMIYLAWTLTPGDTATDPYGNPDTDTLFPGMVEAVKAVLRAAALPQLIIDPWTSVESQVVDVGETMRHEIYVRAAEPQGMKRYDAFLDCAVTEIISA